MAVEKQIIPPKGIKQPVMEDLNRFVSKIASKWHDLGIELLDVEDESALNKIKIEYPYDDDQCCTEMFQLWLEKKPVATWSQLLQALRLPSIKLEAVASEIEGMILQDGHDKDDELKIEDSKIDFTNCTIKEAFMMLMHKINELCMSMPLSTLQFSRAVCLPHIKDESMKCMVEEIKSFKRLFELLAEHPMYCNWMNVRLLEIIAVSSQNKSLINLIQNFKESVYSRPLKEAFRDIPSLKKNLSPYKGLIPKIDSQHENLDDMEVKVLLTISRHLPSEVINSE